MRVIADIPHSKYKIQIFQYNSKYIVKIELGQFEQSYKINESDVSGVDEVKNMITQNLLNNSLDRFISMRSDWGDAFTHKNIEK
mgnify:CR=1 FL=1